MVQITTVGYGDITAQTVMETIVAMVVLFTGAIFFGAALYFLSSQLHRNPLCRRPHAAAQCSASVSRAASRAVSVALTLCAGILLGSISSLLESANKQAKQAQLLREKMASVDGWLSQRKFPQRLRRRIRAFYAEVPVTWLSWLRRTCSPAPTVSASMRACT